VLGDKLGPFLIGLSPAFKKDLERFDEFLSILRNTGLFLSFATARGLTTRFLNASECNES